MPTKHIQMTYNDYIINPFGHSAVMSSITRESVRKNYSERFDTILLRENGKVEYNLYKDSKKNEYYIYIKIPSEVIKKFYYDVVIKFYTDADVKENGRSLSQYYVQFFSNDPAFTFTYAHTFIDAGLFIKDLLPKTTTEALKYKASIKNPKNETGYVKSLYFAYLYIKNHGLFSQSTFDIAEEYNADILINQIEDADDKIRKRQEAGDKLEKQERKEKENPTSPVRTSRNINTNSFITNTKTTGNIKTVKKISGKSNTKFVKTVKRI